MTASGEHLHNLMKLVKKEATLERKRQFSARSTTQNSESTPNPCTDPHSHLRHGKAAECYQRWVSEVTDRATQCTRGQSSHGY
ncbi:hypothetical protein PoB_007478700 [Plakobranchus ocellatus]|uniref:Uncharacterized protein n=1 Tax=Plakobranchus ocellatus TaxID=259542 RepID=A0AAV4DVB8_9GAST|nr:hypothetical protein PoB_007478700 [Plakobranchus ocellatus]